METWFENKFISVEHTGCSYFVVGAIPAAIWRRALFQAWWLHKSGWGSRWPVWPEWHRWWVTWKRSPGDASNSHQLALHRGCFDPADLHRGLGPRPRSLSRWKWEWLIRENETQWLTVLATDRRWSPARSGRRNPSAKSSCCSRMHDTAMSRNRVCRKRELGKWKSTIGWEHNWKINYFPQYWLVKNDVIIF